MNAARVITQLREAGVADPASDYRRLFDWAYAIGARAPEAQTRDAPNDTTLEMLDIGLAQRVARIPLAQIVGSRAFWRLDFKVTADVLDPRPDTELLVELALSEPFSRVLDLGTGSGCIIVTLLAERPKAQGVATDISPAAMRIAGENAARHGVADRLILPLSDWFQDVGGRFDLIVTNPPYIAAAEMAGLQPEVRDNEPREALTDEADGLTAYRVIAANALDHLTPGGRLLVEIGPTQSQRVTGLFRDAGLEDIRTHPDLDGRDRVIAARAPT